MDTRAGRPIVVGVDGSEETGHIGDTVARVRAGPTISTTGKG
jgi:hypothetical protein